MGRPDKLRAVKVQDTDLPPVVCHFPHGPPPAASLVLAEADDDCAEILLLRREDQAGSSSKRKRAQRRLVAKFPRGPITACRESVDGFVRGAQLVYEGKNYGGTDSRVHHRNQHAVGVYDKASGVLRVVPADLYAMRPASAKVAVELPAESKETLQLRGRQKLTQKFGSVRRKQELQRYQMNMTSEENLASDGADIGGALEKGVELAAAAASAAAASFEASRSFLPEGFDKETLIVSEIYPINTLIPPSTREQGAHIETLL